MDRWLVGASAPRMTPQEMLEQELIGLDEQELAKLAGEVVAPRLDRLAAQTKLAADLGRQTARARGDELMKNAGIAGAMGTVLNTVKPFASKALGWAAKNPGHALAAGGAAAGALGGAMAGGQGHRMSGALGGAALGGAAGYGASRLPGGYGQRATQGVTNLAQRGMQAMMPKMALALPSRVGVGAALGGAAGMLHKSHAEAMGMEPGHHLRNAVLGAGAGALAGAGSRQIGRTLAGAEHAAAGAAPAAEHAVAGGVAHSAPGAVASRPPTGVTPGHNPYGATGPGFGGNYSPTELQQMERVRAMANSPLARDARMRRGYAAMKANLDANHSLYGPATPAPTSAGRRVPPAAAASVAHAPTLAKMGGADFLKWAWSTP